MAEIRPIYLDCHAHTPLDHRVAAVLTQAFVDLDANPHSHHVHGQAAKVGVDGARAQVAALVGVEPAEVVFTSGATEANNMALRGVAARLARDGRARVIVGAGEHPSVMAALGGLDDVDVVEASLTSDGIIDLDKLDALLARGAGLVSLAPANHEVGTIQPLRDVAERVRAAGALLHCDLAQTAGRIRIDASLFDLASVSAHKMHGPVGVGALIVRRRLRRHLVPIMRGGGQEGGSRPGSLPAPLAVAFGAACRLADEELEADASRLERMRDRMVLELSALGGMSVNGSGHRLPGNANLSFDGVDGEALAMAVGPRVSMSTGSACTSSSLAPSHVLVAMGLARRRAEGAIRIGLGRGNTPQEVEEATAVIARAVETLRASVRRVA